MQIYFFPIIELAQATSSSQATTPAAPPPPKRGPGRPRTKPPAPPNQGYRGAPRGPRKPKPLPVPIGKSPLATPIHNLSPAVSRPTSPSLSNLEKIPLFHQSNDTFDQTM